MFDTFDEWWYTLFIRDTLLREILRIIVYTLFCIMNGIYSFDLKLCSIIRFLCKHVLSVKLAWYEYYSFVLFSINTSLGRINGEICDLHALVTFELIVLVDNSVLLSSITWELFNTRYWSIWYIPIKINHLSSEFL